MVASFITIHEKRTLAFEPDAVSILFVCVGKSTFSMHLSFFPLTRIHTTIRPHESSITMSLIVFIFPFVYSAIWPGVLTVSVHVACVPISVVFASIQPLIGSLALHLVIHPVSRVESRVWPEVGTETVFLSI